MLPDLRQRSSRPELLDAPDIPRSDLRDNLRELDLINRWLGGHRVTLTGLQRLLTDHQRHWRIVDIGCGGGDTLRALAHWRELQGLQLSLTGVDLKSDCLDFARETCQGLDIEWLQADYRTLENTYDVIICSLFCHHLDDQQLRVFLSWCRTHAEHGLLINDLHRHGLAWAGIRFLTTLFSRSKLVRHDAPLSVLRGFIRSEWEQALSETGWQAELQWCWAFRYRVIGHV